MDTGHWQRFSSMYALALLPARELRPMGPKRTVPPSLGHHLGSYFPSTHPPTIPKAGGLIVSCFVHWLWGEWHSCCAFGVAVGMGLKFCTGYLLNMSGSSCPLAPPH